MMNTLAADIATKTGFACIVDGQRFSGVWDSSRTWRESSGMVWVRFRANLIGFLNEQSVQWELAVREQVHQRGSATELLLGLAGIFEETMRTHVPECEFTTIHTATLKKFATGKGNASKWHMVQAANERWANLYPSGATASHDEADARAMLEYAIEEYGEAAHAAS